MEHTFEIVSEKTWQAEIKIQKALIFEIVTEQQKRKNQHQKHPIEDFLFDYYPYRPSQLLQYSPGLGKILEGEKAKVFTEKKGFAVHEKGVFVNPQNFAQHRIESLKNVIAICKNTFTKKPFFGCFGLHEWAMLYQTEKARHPQLPLRFPIEKINQIVENEKICCSHHDAFRFFTPAAQPLNLLQPSREKQIQNEQNGCLHANMDLYKWCFKFFPFVPSALLIESFLLARKIRQIDMQASPYCLKNYHLPPIAIETPAGKSIYVEHQKKIQIQSQKIRENLILHLESLLANFI